MEAAELLGRLTSAVQHVAQRQPELWQLQAGERSITAQIFLELCRIGWPTGFSVDTEWTREGEAGDFKGRDYDLGVSASSSGESSARPDIMVHRRGRSGRPSNLLIVEFKLRGLRSVFAQNDLEKVRELMTRHGYQAGAVVSLGTGHRPQNITAYWLISPNQEPDTVQLF